MQEEHKKTAPQSIHYAIITVSDSRTVDTDISGKIINDLLKKHSHQCIDYSVIKDNKKLIHEKITQLLQNPKIEVIITNGGTGITEKDVTIETVKPLFEKELIGFSSLFSQISYQDIGPAAFLSRATAGTVNHKIIFCLPGSPQAVELAMNKLILSELSHLVKHLGD